MTNLRLVLKVMISLVCVLVLYMCRDLFVIGASHLYLLYRVQSFLSGVVLLNAFGYGLAAVLTALMLTAGVFWLWISSFRWIDRKTRSAT